MNTEERDNQVNKVLEIYDKLFDGNCSVSEKLILKDIFKINDYLLKKDNKGKETIN